MEFSKRMKLMDELSKRIQKTSKVREDVADEIARRWMRE
jgi:hypothetical protein